MQAVFYFLPQRSLFQGALHKLICGTIVPIYQGSPGNIIVDGLGERIWFLKNHSDTTPDFYCIHFFTVEIFITKNQLTFNPGTVYKIIHSV